MKRNSLSLSLFAVCLFFFSLNYSFAVEDKRKEVSERLKESVLSILEENERLHSSMFEYKKAALKESVEAFKKKAMGIKDKKIEELLKPALRASSELMTNKTKAEDNESYHRLSLSLVKIVESFQIGSTYNIYYCPMVKKRWVQNSKKMRKVHNPYAPEMPHCGGQITEF